MVNYSADNLIKALQQLQKEQERFNKELEKTRKTLDLIYNQKRTMQLDHKSAMKQIIELKKALEPLHQQTKIILTYSENVMVKLKELEKQLLLLTQLKVPLNIELIEPKQKRFEFKVWFKDQITDGLNKIKARFLEMNKLIIKPAIDLKNNLHQKKVDILVSLNDHVSSGINKLKAKMETLKNFIIKPFIHLQQPKLDKVEVKVGIKDHITEGIAKLRAKLDLLQNFVIKPVIDLKNKLQQKKIEIQVWYKDHVSSQLAKLKSNLETMKNMVIYPVIYLKTKLQQTKLEIPILTKDHVTGFLQKLKGQLLPKTLQITTRLKDLASDGINKIKTKYTDLKQKMELTSIRIGVWYIDNVSSKIEKTKNNLNKLKSHIVSPIVTLKDKATALVKNIKASISAILKNPFVVAITTTTVALVKQGVQEEKQRFAVASAVATANHGQSPAAITAMQNSYLADLRKNADKSPFSRAEIADAGVQAVRVTGGDTGAAMDLVKVAENMAALNPGKSLTEAIQALVSLKSGDTSQVAQFGVQANENDVKQAGGFEAFVQMKIKPQFAGGTEKFMNTGEGLISTIRGKMQSKFSDVGLGMLEKLKPTLKTIVDLIDRFSPVFDKLSNIIVTGFGYALTPLNEFGQWFSQQLPAIGSAVESTFQWFGDNFGWIGKEAGFMKTTISKVWNGVASVLRTGWSIAKPVFDILAWSIKHIYGGFKTFFPIVEKGFRTIWGKVEPVLKGIAGMLTSVVTNIKKFKALGSFVEGIVVAFLLFKGALLAYKGVMAVIKAATWAWQAAQLAVNVVMNLSPIGLITLAIGGLIAAAVMVVQNFDKIKEKFAEVTKWIKEKWEGLKKGIGSVFTWIFGGKEDKSKGKSNDGLQPPQAATGLTRVPRNNYPVILHEGERVLTKRESLLYSRHFEAFQANSSLQRVESRQANGGSPQITIAKIAESIVIREEADIQKIANALAASLETVAFNYAGR